MATLSEITALHKALGDPTRLRILAILAGSAFAGSALRVSEIVEILDMGQSRVSRHLKILLDAGVLSARRSGVWIFYSIREEGTYRELVRSTISLLEQNSGDIERKERVLAERRNETVRFFDTRAGEWEQMKRQIFLDLDPDSIAASAVGTCSAVADLGCGDGRLAALLARSGLTVIGVDNAPAMLDYAREKHAEVPGVEFRLGEVEHLPLQNAEVSCAVLSLVLHHLALPEQALREAARVVRPGGKVVITEFAPHGNETLREVHGDRWLGIDRERIETWMGAHALTITKIQTYRLSEAMEMYCMVASKNQRR